VVGVTDQDSGAIESGGGERVGGQGGGPAEVDSSDAVRKAACLVAFSGLEGSFALADFVLLGLIGSNIAGTGESNPLVELGDVFIGGNVSSLDGARVKGGDVEVSHAKDIGSGPVLSGE
jgi:hypothetical protein